MVQYSWMKSNKVNNQFDIKKLLINKDWSKEYLAQKLNTDVSMINSWESGKATPSNSIINQLNIISGIL